MNDYAEYIANVLSESLNCSEYIAYSLVHNNDMTYA
jgi:hypothetical protein